MDPISFDSRGVFEAIRLANQAGRSTTPVGRAESPAGFSKALEAALDNINESQNKAVDLSKKFQLGHDDVSLEETMVAIQKANIEFQAAVQVRNRLVSAYHDIMNMQI
jgi:flagellar hook-basal body complex protein FliE